MTTATHSQPSVVQMQVTSATHFRLGPSVPGFELPLRRGRRIDRARAPVCGRPPALRAGPQGPLAHQAFNAMQSARVPSSKSSCQIHRVPEVRSERRKLERMATDSSSSRIDRSLLRLVSQAWKPLRDASSASHIHFTGQIPQCFETKPNIKAGPWRSGPRLLQYVTLIFELCDLPAKAAPFSRRRLQLAVTKSCVCGNRPARTDPSPQPCRMDPRSLIARAVLKARCVIASTASCLNSRLNTCLVMGVLRFPEHLMSGSTQPAAGQNSIVRSKASQDVLHFTAEWNLSPRSERQIHCAQHDRRAVRLSLVRTVGTANAPKSLRRPSDQVKSMS